MDAGILAPRNGVVRAGEGQVTRWCWPCGRWVVGGEEEAREALCLLPLPLLHQESNRVEEKRRWEGRGELVRVGIPPAANKSIVARRSFAPRAPTPAGSEERGLRVEN